MYKTENLPENVLPRSPCTMTLERILDYKFGDQAANPRIDKIPRRLVKKIHGIEDINPIAYGKIKALLDDNLDKCFDRDSQFKEDFDIAKVNFLKQMKRGLGK